MTVRLLRLKPVAIFCSRRRRSGSRSPASCSIDELVERLVAVEGGDHPVAPGPHGPGEVVLVAVGVGVAGRVEPVHGHALAVARRGQQAIDQLARRRPGERSARKASTSAGVGGRPVRSSVTRRISVSRDGLGRRRQPLALAAGRGRSGRSALRGQARRSTAGSGGRSGGSKAQCLPQAAPCSIQRRRTSFCAAVSLRFDFGGGITLVGVGAGDAADQLALAALARRDDGQSAVLGVEPQLGLAGLRRPARGTGSSSPTGSAARRGRSAPAARAPRRALRLSAKARREATERSEGSSSDAIAAVRVSKDPIA